MKKLAKRILSVLMIAIMLIVSAPIGGLNLFDFSANAANENMNADNDESTERSNESIRISVKTDKKSYSVTDIAIISVSVENIGLENVENITAKADFTELAPIKGGNTSKTVDTLSPGESFSFTYKATINKNAVNINVFQKILLFFVRLFNGGYTEKSEDINDGRAINLQKDVISFGKHDVENTVKVWSKKQDNNYITREKWIGLLGDTLCWSDFIDEENTEKFFDDISNVENEDYINYAAQLGFFDESDGTFNPDEFATREFVAASAIRALGFTEEVSTDFSDKSETAYLTEISIADSVGIMSAVNNKFFPKRFVTTNQANEIAEKILEIDDFDTEKDDFYSAEYTKEYVQLNIGENYEQSGENLFILPKTNETENIKVNSIICLGDEYYKIVSVGEENGNYVLSTQEAEMYEVFTSVKYSQQGFIDANTFVPADGVTVEQDEELNSKSSIGLNDLSLTIDKKINSNIKLYGKVAVKNIYYNGAVDMELKVPSLSDIVNANDIIKVKDVHAILSYDLEATLGVKASTSTKKDGYITLGSFPVYGAGDVGVYIEVGLGYSFDGSVEIKFSTHCRNGYQIINNHGRAIVQSSKSTMEVATAEAKLKIGPKVCGLLQITKKFKLIDFDLYGGVAAGAELKIRDNGLRCAEINAYVFLEFEAMQQSAISNWFDLKYKHEFWKSNNSPIKCSLHFENGNRVINCTYNGSSTNTDLSKGYIYFGSYPQSLVTNSTTIAALNSRAPSWSNWRSYGYYNYYDEVITMRYTDVIYSGSKYRGVKFTQYRSISTIMPFLTDNVTCDSIKQNQSNNGYFTDTVYWFKFESLKWNVINQSTGFVVCDSIIDSQPYRNVFKDYGNDYTSSSIRAWLNDDFYYTAFTDSERNKISTSSINTDGTYLFKITGITISVEATGTDVLNDKIYLPSYQEAQYISSSQGSDYAKCQGLYENQWVVRSPVWDIGFDFLSPYKYPIFLSDGIGFINDNKTAYSTGLGIRPAMKIK